MKKNLKFLIGSIALGLMVTFGIGATSQITKATQNNQTQVSTKTSVDDEPLSDAQWIQELIEADAITKEYGELELAYINASTDDEKQKAYEKLLDYSVANGEMTAEQANYRKTLRHDADLTKPDGMTDAQWVQKLLELGEIDKPTADFQLAYINATTDAERQKVYEDMIKSFLAQEFDYYKGLKHSYNSTYGSIDIVDDMMEE